MKLIRIIICLTLIIASLALDMSSHRARTEANAYVAMYKSLGLSHGYKEWLRSPQNGYFSTQSSSSSSYSYSSQSSDMFSSFKRKIKIIDDPVEEVKSTAPTIVVKEAPNTYIFNIGGVAIQPKEDIIESRQYIEMFDLKELMFKFDYYTDGSQRFDEKWIKYHTFIKETDEEAAKKPKVTRYIDNIILVEKIEKVGFRIHYEVEDKINFIEVKVKNLANLAADPFCNACPTSEELDVFLYKLQIAIKKEREEFEKKITNFNVAAYAVSDLYNRITKTADSSLSDYEEGMKNREKKWQEKKKEIETIETEITIMQTSRQLKIKIIEELSLKITNCETQKNAYRIQINSLKMKLEKLTKTKSDTVAGIQEEIARQLKIIRYHFNALYWFRLLPKKMFPNDQNDADIIKALENPTSIQALETKLTAAFNPITFKLVQTYKSESPNQ